MTSRGYPGKFRHFQTFPSRAYLLWKENSVYLNHRGVRIQTFGRPGGRIQISEFAILIIPEIYYVYIYTSKIESLLKQNLHEWLINNKQLDPRILTLRIDRIILSKDLSLAKIFCYHEQSDASLIRILNKQNYFIRKHIVNNMKIRKIPKFKFYESELESQDQKLDSILTEIANKYNG